MLNVRPYAKVNGPRQVPILSSANGVPFLRLTKPQPANLSRVLRQKLDRRLERFHERVILSHYEMPLATQEDQWDEMLRRELGLVEGHGEARWADAVALAQRENVKWYEQEMAKDRLTAAKMQKIVDQETALAIQEGRPIARGRKERQKAGFGDSAKAKAKAKAKKKAQAKAIPKPKKRK